LYIPATTDWKGETAFTWPRSISERTTQRIQRFKTCARRGSGSTSTLASCCTVTGSRRIASHSMMLSSTAESRANCSCRQITHAAKNQFAAVLQKGSNLAGQTNPQSSAPRFSVPRIPTIALQSSVRVPWQCPVTSCLGSNTWHASASELPEMPSSALAFDYLERREHIGFFAAREQDAAHVFGFRRAAQQSSIALICGQYTSAALCLLHHAFEIIQHSRTRRARRYSNKD